MLLIKNEGEIRYFVLSALSATDCLIYSKVKAAVFSSSLRLIGKNLEAERKAISRLMWSLHATNCHFNCRCSAANVSDFKGLCVVLEQFKNSVPQRIATYTSEQRATNMLKVALILS